jgi:hypothetical protein
MRIDDRPRSFGEPEAEATIKENPGRMPVPVLHVGEVHAELRLHITDETLTDLGSQIASMIAQAAHAGFAEGLRAAMAEADDGQIDVLADGDRAS